VPNSPEGGRCPFHLGRLKSEEITPARLMAALREDQGEGHRGPLPYRRVTSFFTSTTGAD